MISNQKELYAHIDKILKPYGYIKKKDTWYLHTEECICFLSIVKSPFGGHYDNVMGCFLKELYDSTDMFPKYYKNDLKFGIGDIENKELVKKVLDLENRDFIDIAREETIKDLIENYIIPFLKDMSTKVGIKKSISKYPNLKYYIAFRLKKALSIEDLDDASI